MCLTLFEQLAEEDAETGCMDRIDKENSPYQCPVCVVEHGFADTVESCSWTWNDEKTETSDNTDKNEVDDHRSCDPDKIVDPCSKTIDA